jgi:DNA anti-recombination protein RmuC
MASPGESHRRMSRVVEGLAEGRKELDRQAAEQHRRLEQEHAGSRQEIEGRMGKSREELDEVLKELAR